MNASEHYFSEDPSVAFIPKEITVLLAGEPRRVFTAGGVFSPGQLDRGTEVLLQSIPAPVGGPILDLGSGWGPIALDAALASPQHEVWALDVNSRARELTLTNAERLGLTNIRAVEASQIPGGLQFAEIRSNPPIRIGKTALHEILRTWLPRLAPGGIAYLVVAKKLGADSLQRWVDTEFAELTVDRFARAKGFHVIRVVRGVS